MKKLTGQYTIGDREVAMSSPGENLIVTKVHVKHLFPHYKKENNVRVADELGYDTHGMAVTLAEDGYVIEEVHASVRTVQPIDFIKAATEDEIVSLLKDTMGLKGYRRICGAYSLYQDPTRVHYPRDKEFDEYIPVKLHFNMSAVDEIMYISDHSQNKPLTEYELGLVIKKQIEFGTEAGAKAICWNHRRLFDSASTSKKTQELENKLKEVVTTDPVERLAKQKDIVLDHYKGRFQRLQRVFTGPNCEVLMENFRRQVYNIKGDGVVVPSLTQKQMVAIWDLSPEDFKTQWDILCAEALKTPAKVENNSWTKDVWESKKAAFAPSKILTDAFDGAVGGNKEAVKHYEQHLHQLVVFERAVAKVGFEAVKAVLEAL